MLKELSMRDCDKNQWYQPEECPWIDDSLSQSHDPQIHFEQEWRCIPLNTSLFVWIEIEWFVDVESQIQMKEWESILEVLMNRWVEETEDNANPFRKEWLDNWFHWIVGNERVVHRSDSTPIPIHIVHRLDKEMELYWECVDIEEKENEDKDILILEMIEEE